MHGLNLFKLGTSSIFTIEEINLNIVIVEGGYMSGIIAKNMYKSKFSGCKSIHPLRLVLGGSNFCSNDCYESFWVGLPALYREMVKYLPIFHVKIALVLPSMMRSLMDCNLQVSL